MHRTASWARRALVAPAAAALFLASGSATALAAEPWVTAPASRNVGQLSELFWLTLVLAGIVFILVEALLIYSSLRFRRRSPVPAVEPPQIHGNTRLEVMWAIVPAVILIGLFGVSVQTLGATSTPPPDAMRVEVQAFQFAWQFHYPDQDVDSTGELRIPVGRAVVFDVTARDVIHSFWVPQLFGKIDAVPGRTNRTWTQADVPGTFRGVCAELCGAGHDGMFFTVQAVSEDEFNSWIEQLKSGASAAGGSGSDAQVAQGKQLFQSKGCVGCHTLAAVPGASGTTGPDLDGVGTHAATRKPGMSAADYINESIDNPTAFTVPGFPAGVMPKIEMTDDERAALVALLLAQK
jgi:cytochrome c oxidase subunit 2